MQTGKNDTNSMKFVNLATGNYGTVDTFWALYNTLVLLGALTGLDAQHSGLGARVAHKINA